MLSSAEIEREFRAEIQQKKRTASGVHHKTGKNGYTGVVRFPHQLLRGKEKREYTKPGKVRGFNMYTAMLPLEDLKTYNQDRQKEIVEKWREIHKAKEIQEALGIDRNSYYDLLYKLGVLERPESAKPKKGTGVKRDKPNAQADEIVKFQDLKLMPKEKQLEILDDYNERYNLASVADIWGRDVKNVYSLRYTLRKKLGKPNVYQTNTEQNVNEHKQQVLNIEMSDDEQEIDEINRIEEENREPQQEEPQVDNPIVEEPKIKGKELFEDIMKLQNHRELEELRIMVQEQAKLLQSIVENQNKVAAAVDEPTPKNSGTAAFTMNFEKQTEGFMLHQDLERFISVLKKNPDQFKVEVKITRIEE